MWRMLHKNPGYRMRQSRQLIPLVKTAPPLMSFQENILFGAPYDEERYKKVIKQCALTRDLELFDAGDATEVGEKGLTLRQVSPHRD